MMLLGLPNETLEFDNIFGHFLVSLDTNDPDNHPVVTMIWETNFNLLYIKTLYTVLSLEYNAPVLDMYKKERWLFELLAQPRPETEHSRMGTTNDLLTVQALAFDQVSQIRKDQSHDRTTHRPTPEHGGEGQAVRDPARQEA